ncbi:hypothetical protein E2R56_21160 [Rhodococcus qingshengii]|nr:hypothetical protein E2R56_21160 [Rhodococcus qingshengii]
MKQYYFVKEGTPNAYITSPIKEVTMCDTVTATLKLDNIQSLSSASWAFANLDKNFEIVDAKANAELSQYGEAKVTLTNSGTPTVQLDLPSTTPIHDKVAAVDLTLKVKESAFSTSVKLDPTVSVTNPEGTTNLIVQTNYLKVNPFASNTPAPIDQVDGKTLEDTLNELGIDS